jgi:hypothetical protein
MVIEFWATIWRSLTMVSSRLAYRVLVGAEFAKKNKVFNLVQ